MNVEDFTIAALIRDSSISRRQEDEVRLRPKTVISCKIRHLINCEPDMVGGSAKTLGQVFI